MVSAISASPGTFACISTGGCRRFKSKRQRRVFEFRSAQGEHGDLQKRAVTPRCDMSHCAEGKLRVMLRACPQLAPSMPAGILVNLVTVCFFKNTGSICPSVMLLVEREMGGIERVLFAVEKQIVELDHVQRQKPGRLTMRFMVQP